MGINAFFKSDSLTHMNRSDASVPVVIIDSDNYNQVDLKSPGQTKLMLYTATSRSGGIQYSFTGSSCTSAGQAVFEISDETNFALGTYSGYVRRADGNGVVSSLAVTTSGGGYSSIPTLTISAPEISGTTATGYVSMTFSQGAVTILNRGASFNVGDILMHPSSASTSATWVVMSTDPSGGISSLFWNNGGEFIANPLTLNVTPVAVQSASGSGLVVSNLTMKVAKGYVTNGGSGYNDTPTCTLSSISGSGGLITASCGDSIDVSITQTPITIIIK